MRVFVTIILPLILPTLLYLLYVFVLRREADPQQSAAATAGSLPWVWLGVAGAVLMLVTFFTVAQLDRAPPGSSYQPARVIDGVIQPGHQD
jgi:hypothetical protein